MIVDIYARNAPQALPEALWKLRTDHVEEGSRNGPVYRLRNPAYLTLEEPRERVIFDPIRDANPFFHLMEAIWMLGGHRDVTFPAFFNKKYTEYAEEDGNVHGAYGHRWRKHFCVDQIEKVVSLLGRDINTRRAVLGMWDPGSDLGVNKKDLPCNTHIYFRMEEHGLCMTVCNRSNDLIWGMLGANVIHFTMLQELIAHELVVELGNYHVFSNNLHFYKNMYRNSDELWNLTHCEDPYFNLEPMTLLRDKETISMFLRDCFRFPFDLDSIETHWMKTVALPMFQCWFRRSSGIGDGLELLESIPAPDWKLACQEWIKRRQPVAVV